ncbi:hypothetical protein EYF80_011115 [Liparis tanakae]|uniref:Uncharacterized protein n=1 Tax=Liparis tanakae TaxID=230148 RepID=A0A4Z2ILP3_9TELE|nr:hypothetical protein EYF80_011115 [Liparis tanakae]
MVTMELIQGMVSVTHYQHWSLVNTISPKLLIGQQSLSNLEADRRITPLVTPSGLVHLAN